MDSTQIMSLPETVRGYLFNYIPQRESVNLRLVCRTWNQEIQNHYDFEIKELNEDSPHFNSMLQLRIKKLQIHKLISTPVLLNPNGTSIFKHPNTIRTLAIKAPVAQLNLQIMLGLFQENLVEICLNVTPKICNHQFTQNLSYHFKNVSSLKIECQLIKGETRERVGGMISRCEFNPRSLFQVFENSSMPKLQKLKVNLNSLSMKDIAIGGILENVIRILAKQRKLLEYLYLDIPRTHVIDQYDSPINLNEEELLQIQEIRALKYLQLNVEPLSCVLTKQFWKAFIRNQKNLEGLFLRAASEYPQYPVSLKLCRQIILNNCSTLVHLDILELHIKLQHQPFDLGVFQNCTSLKILYLSNHEDHGMNPDVENFNCLPDTITQLGMKNFLILTSELLIAFKDGLTKLQKLVLWNCGNDDMLGNGIDVPVLEQILVINRPNLTRVEILNGFRVSLELNTLLSQLGLSDKIFTHYRLKKNSSSQNWHPNSLEESSDADDTDVEM